MICVLNLGLREFRKVENHCLNALEYPRVIYYASIATNACQKRLYVETKKNFVLMSELNVVK